MCVRYATSNVTRHPIVRYTEACSSARVAHAAAATATSKVTVSFHVMWLIVPSALNCRGYTYWGCTSETPPKL